MVELPNPVKDFYQERIEENQAYMRYLQADAGKMQELRESSWDDWEMEELARHILFLEAQIIEGLRGEIENDREALRKLG